jgi:hypothetical protein
MDLQGVTDELYGEPPDRFTARRDELARQAAAEGDKALATAVRGLRRPTAAAWVVNHLVREDSDAVEALVGLGERMREAQSSLSGAQMRALSRERQSMLRELVRHAAALAGGSVSASVTVEVEQTLRAVLADEDASAAVRSGCLTHGLAYSGLGPAGAGVTGRHLRAVPDAAGRPSSHGAGEVSRDGSGDEREDGSTPVERDGSEREAAEREASEREAAQRRARRRELAEAESGLRSSERAAEAATARAERARRRQQEAVDDVAECERAWQAARERAAAAGAAAETASDQAAAAQAVAEAARQEVDRLRPLLDGS